MAHFVAVAEELHFTRAAARAAQALLNILTADISVSI